MASTDAIVRSDRAIYHQANMVMIVSGVFLSIAWLAVLLRTFVRTFIISAFGWDDFAMVFTNVRPDEPERDGKIACVRLTKPESTGHLQCLCSIRGRHVRHRQDHVERANRRGTVALTAEGQFQYRPIIRNTKIHVRPQYLIPSIMLYIATTIAFKIALGMFYLRIMVRLQQQRIVYATIAISTVYGVFFFFFTLFQCGDPAQFFVREFALKCLPNRVLLPVNIVAGIVNTLAEWIFAVLPIFMIRKADMPRAAKISAAGLLILGTVGSFCSVVRLVFISTFAPGPNFVSSSVTYTLWSIAECGICITAASLAGTRPLFHSCMEHAKTLRTVTPFSATRSKGTLTSTSRLSRSDKHGAHVLSDMSSRDEVLSGHSDVDWEAGDNGTYTTVLGNSRVMEKMGVTHETMIQAGGKKSIDLDWRQFSQNRF